MITSITRFKDIKGYENLYAVSDTGRVISLRKCRDLSSSLTKKRYETVSLYKEGSLKSFLVHQLVAKAFIDNPENRKEINHSNSIRFDNRVGNLEWSTRSENMKHAHQFGKKSNVGTKNPRCKLSEDDVHNIRESTEPTSEIANRFRISKSTVIRIKNRKIWKHL